MRARKDQRRHEMLLKRFINYLDEEKSFTPNTRRNYFAAVRNFYMRNYVPRQFFRRDGPPTIGVLEGNKAAPKEDLRKMYNVSNAKERGLILFLKDTGLSQSDVARMKIKVLGINTLDEFYQRARRYC